jgi:uncharacterized HAD superfamily protein
MSKDRLCIDSDNVLAQTDEVMRRVIRDYTQGRVNLEPQHITNFDYDRCKDKQNCGITAEQWRDVHALFSEPRYLWCIQPVPGVQECLKALGKRFDLHLATSRLPKARRVTVEWLEAHDFPPHDLHFLKHKEKHFSLGRFAAAVEDHYEQAVEFAKTGTPSYLIEHPWNRGREAVEMVEWVDGWQKLTALLLGNQGQISTH